MKWTYLVAGLLFSWQATAADLVLGAPAPDVQARLLDSGESFQLSQQIGKVVVVNFWATWCVPCRAEMPAMQAFYDKHKAEGLEILAISMDEARDVAQVRAVAHQYSFLVALKSDASFKGLGRIWRMPTTFVIDRHGLLQRNGQVGEATVTMESLESLITPLLAR